jgi:hypothetical protein
MKTSARLNRMGGNPLRRRACRWCEGMFQPKRSDTETTCSSACASASLSARSLTPEQREELRQAAVRARRALDDHRAEQLRERLDRKAAAENRHED